MLISFSVENYLSIKDRVELSMQAMPDKASDDNILKNNYQTFSLSEKEDKKYNILKSSIIYGLNASGKTNILQALKVFAEFIVESYERGNKDVPVAPFKLNSEIREQPSTFEATIFLNGAYYRYGFSATKNYISKEWLFSSTKGRERRIFYRERQENSEVYDFFNSKFRDSHKKVRDNSLLITVASLDNNLMAQNIVTFFENIRLRQTRSKTLPLPEHRVLLQDIMKSLDIGMSSLAYQKTDIDTEMKDVLEQMLVQLPVPPSLNEEEARELRQQAQHLVHKNLSEHEELFFAYEDNTGKEIFLHENLQSLGTLIVFSLFAEILNSYKTSGILLIDEVEESLHPLLLAYFFKFFHAIPNNKIQLICTTHNVLLMGEGFRKDQLYITEKDEHLATSLVSIDDFTGISKKTPKQIVEMYLAGHFGGVPALSDLDIRKVVHSLSEE